MFMVKGKKYVQVKEVRYCTHIHVCFRKHKLFLKFFYLLIYTLFFLFLSPVFAIIPTTIVHVLAARWLCLCPL